MFVYVLLACLVVVHGSSMMPQVNKPQPYSFGYTIKDKEGVQHRQESGNGAGVVQGNYGFIDNKGIRRQVDYKADDGGFRAQVKTNEPGTAKQNPAAVNMISNDPYSQGSAVPYISRPNVPYVPALDNSDPVYGFPTVRYFQPSAAELGSNMYNSRYMGNSAYGSGYMGNSAYGSGYMGNSAYGSGYMGNSAYGSGNMRNSPYDSRNMGNSAYGSGYMRNSPYDSRYMGGLAYSNMLGAGYRQPGGIVYFGANLIGGRITGHNTIFTAL